jgi:1,4-dihydroxy-2-naphthoate octaprenyltransferase
MPLRAVWDFLQLTRPAFLLGGALLYGLGLAVAISQGVAIDPARGLLGQLLITAIQLTAHYANEYYDVETDRLNALNRTLFSGGSGVLAGGRLAPSVALRAARSCAAAGLFLILILGFVEPGVAFIGALALLGSWFYSAPPLALMGSGWGEISASLIVAGLTPLTGYVLQAHRLDPILLAVCLPLALIHWAMLLAFEFPDFEADAAVGKMTQAVRLGRDRAALLHNALIALAFVLIVIAPVPPARLALWAAPLAAWQAAGVLWRARRGWAGFAWLTLGAVSLFALTALLWAVGFVMA